MPADGSFPLVLFSPSANPPHLYSAILQELASHGYIAVGICHTYEPMPLTVFADARPRLARLSSLGGALASPGRRPYEVDLRERAQVVAVKAADLSFVASRLRAGDPTAGRLLPAIDRDKWAVIGHSFGGGAAVEVCLQEDPPAAGVSLDGGLWRSPDSVSPTGPILQLFAEHPEYATDPGDAVRRGYFTREEYAEVDRATTVGAWEMLHRGATPGYSGVVSGASHTDFCDWPMLPLRRWSPARRTRGAGEAGRTFRTITDALLEFLALHVQEASRGVRGAVDDSSDLRTGTPTELFAMSASEVAA
ncbi:MAG: hypothetical protein IT336_03210 [Thermomicrobiales bacterium]|nr:hypothetical protein [Thermomicrobiales bacterium]